MIIEAIEKGVTARAVTVEQLIEDHFAEIYRFASRRLGREDAEDATLETFQAAIEQLHRIRGNQPLLWLLGIARRKVANHQRSTLRRKENPLRKEIQSGDADNLDQVEADAKLRQVVLSLPKLQRDALLLQHLEGLTVSQIAVVTHWFVRVGGGPPQGPISISFNQENEPGGKLAFTYTAEPERIRGEFPAYMPFMWLPIGTHENWLAMRNDASASEYEQVKDYAGAERFLRKVVEVTEKGGERSIFRPADVVYRLASALEHEGKKSEAYATYVRAKEVLAASRLDDGRWPKKQIDAGIALLKPQSSP